MSKPFRNTLFAVCLLCSVTLCSAQTQQPVEIPPAAPVPAQVLAAKRVFIGNAAGDNDPGITKYTNGPDGLYNQFYVDVKNLARYDLVAAPSDADVVLELRVDYALYNRDFSYPKFRLEIRDPKSNVLLWSFTEPVNGAFLAKTGRKNVAQALSKLSDDLKKIGTT